MYYRSRLYSCFRVFIKIVSLSVLTLFFLSVSIQSEVGFLINWTCWTLLLCLYLFWGDRTRCCCGRPLQGGNIFFFVFYCEINLRIVVSDLLLIVPVGNEWSNQFVFFSLFFFYLESLSYKCKSFQFIYFPIFFKTSSGF